VTDIDGLIPDGRVGLRAALRVLRLGKERQKHELKHVAEYPVQRVALDII
jgi:hypothetical protein